MYSPAWSNYRIPNRREIVRLERSFADILAGEYAVLERRRRNILAGELEKALRQQDGSTPTVEITPLTEDEESDEGDTDYILPHGGIDLPVKEYRLRPRLSRVPLADITPAQDIVTGQYLVSALGFRRVEWNGPGLFVDSQGRIGAVFLGPPVQSDRWATWISSANNAMRIASAHLNRARLSGDTIRSGFAYDPVLQRPRQIDRAYDLTNIVVLAALRYSPAIQEITSFQNAMLRDVAPRLWEHFRDVVDSVLLNDTSLHAPMHQTDFGPHQPTAFSEIEYHFSMTEGPRREPGDHPSAFRAITSLGKYDATEGELVLWNERTILAFPPGSTFLFAERLVRYSFTEVRKPGWQMLISQSCGAGLPDMPRATGSRPSRSQRPGSTADNPLLVDENGRLVISLASPRRNRQSRKKPLTPAAQAADRPSRTRVRRPGKPGVRAPRERALLEGDLYLSAARPPVMTTERPHYECGICLHIKSHPVSYRCGHSHCLVCIRTWLEYSWICPVCRKTMYEKPMPNDDIQRGIAFDHPEFVDPSRVDLSFDGLTFPTKSTVKFVVL
ncbi:hypothetical protein DFH06DRAFT_1317826 [Mycena polygramma]|nr:hypothetical protein DFH06DRAFT_1317826 [Mycena polygramma]